MMCRRRQVAFINDVIITNAFSISRGYEVKIVFFSISFKKEIGLITVFITSSLIVIICVLMKNKNEQSPFIKNLIVVVWRIHCSQMSQVFLPQFPAMKLNSHVQAPSADA
jgi:hypothetical protein